MFFKPQSSIFLQSSIARKIIKLISDCLSYQQITQVNRNIHRRLISNMATFTSEQNIDRALRTYNNLSTDEK